MKLRIRGNSIRLRLTQTEVERVGAGERVEEVLAFGTSPDQKLTYALEASGTTDKVDAKFQENTIAVYLPRELASAWAKDDKKIGIDGEHVIDDETRLKLLVEKDFACLTERRDEDADTFPHPMSGKLKC